MRSNEKNEYFNSLAEMNRNGRNMSANNVNELGCDLDPSVDCNVMISGEKGIEMYNN